MSNLQAIQEKHEEHKKKVEQFSELLDNIENTSDKKKKLWKEIYENALYDRVNAEMLFTEIYTTMQNNVSEHTTVGPMLAKYLERMHKSNEQLLKLAELISKAEEQSNKISPDDIFSQISGQ